MQKDILSQGDFGKLLSFAESSQDDWWGGKKGLSGGKFFAKSENFRTQNFGGGGCVGRIQIKRNSYPKK